MSMYQMIFGRNPQADMLLRILGLTKEDFARFRDVYVTGDEIAVYTRIGGGNRPYYQEAYKKVKVSPNYLRYEDDEFDSTYATFYFSFPKEYEEDLKKMDRGEWSGEEAWQELFERLRKTGKP